MPRRSPSIQTCVLLTAAALALGGCDERRDCVDADGRKQPDAYCDGTGRAHFIYGGRGGRSIGSSIRGGSASPEAGVSRGGFGGGGEGGGGE